MKKTFATYLYIHGKCPRGTAELGYVTIGYLRRCCEFRNYSNPIDFDLVKHLLVTKVSYHWNLFEEIQILNLI